MKIRTVCMLGTFGLFALACGAEDAKTTTEGGSISVGLAHPFTGALATQGTNFEQAILLAQKQINDHGGIRGMKLELIEKDTQTNADVAATVAESLVKKKVAGILSGDGTASILSMLKVTVPAETVMVVGTAQSPVLARAENNGLFFRPTSTTLDEVRTLVDAMVGDGTTKLAVISSTNPYTTSLGAAVEKSFAASVCTGGACAMTNHGTYPSDADLKTFDFSSLVKDALASGADSILFASSAADAKALMSAAWAEGYRGYLYTSAAAGNDNLAPFLTAEQAAKVKWATLEEAAGPSADFVRDLWVKAGFRAQDFVGPVHTNFDATFVLGLALAQANSTDGNKVAAAMMEVANPPGKKIYAGDWAKAMEAIEAGEDIDYVGVASDVDFDDLGNIKIGTVVKGYKDGVPVILSQ